ncbi:murein hydrolase activator EnvC family protein [Blastochloris tepida]|uniref:Membrane protein n=1 Tax=Blastochloris tepida TaxID=2233851 RepID=A0A348G4W0_9HYPH|nr:peptidoglycan DD-metalloendopeptidase family protein [Blastochloris tepida]BBF94593.1 membrane protein [Blastochloris tepida]
MFAALAVLPPAALSRGALAQDAPGREAAGASREEKARELDALREDRRRAAEAEARIRAEIDAIRDDRRALTQTLIDTAARVRAVEGRIASSEARLPLLDNEAARIRSALEGRRRLLADLLAVLQRMGRTPPPALIAKPEDVLEAVRSAMLVGSFLPELRLETQALASDLAEMVRLRREIAEETKTLEASRASLAEEHTRLSALVEERQKRERESEQALEAQRQRARDLARQAETLEKLISSMEAGPAAKAAEAAAKSGAAAPGARPGNALAALKDPGRLSPAMPFDQAKGLLPLPVNGVRLREFGDRDAVGGVERGLSVGTRANAQVTSPCDGWVVFAGPFRSYGQLLIINAGGGYHILLAGMDRITAQLGQFVLTGEPVGVMGGGPQAAALVSIGTSQPTLYVEFRKDGTAIDPGPWWMATESEKVRG